MDRNEVIQIRVSHDEKRRYAAAAKKVFLSVSEWLRKIGDKEAGK